MGHFDHEKLDVYQAGIEFVAKADDIVEQLPRGRAYLADQLQRAATSVPLNVAEGAGEFSRKDKARFYRMALRSATECAALLDVCRKVKLSDEATLGAGRDLLLRIVSMLTKMAKLLGEQEEPIAQKKNRAAHFSHCFSVARPEGNDEEGRSMHEEYRAKSTSRSRGAGRYERPSTPGPSPATVGSCSCGRPTGASA